MRCDQQNGAVKIVNGQQDNRAHRLGVRLQSHKPHNRTDLDRPVGIGDLDDGANLSSRLLVLDAGRRDDAPVCRYDVLPQATISLKSTVFKRQRSYQSPHIVDWGSTHHQTGHVDKS